MREVLSPLKDVSCHTAPAPALPFSVSLSTLCRVWLPMLLYSLWVTFTRHAWIAMCVISSNYERWDSSASSSCWILWLTFLFRAVVFLHVLEGWSLCEKPHCAAWAGCGGACLSSGLQCHPVSCFGSFLYFFLLIFEWICLPQDLQRICIKSNNFNASEYLKANLRCFSSHDSLSIIKFVSKIRHLSFRSLIHIYSTVSF